MYKINLNIFLIAYLVNVKIIFLAQKIQVNSLSNLKLVWEK